MAAEIERKFLLGEPPDWPRPLTVKRGQPPPWLGREVTGVTTRTGGD
ncbi:MAG: hypothetical protein WA862_02995 [Solirubrobacterales bacterium]